MKRITLLMMALAASVMLLTSCSKEHKLEGTWKAVSNTFTPSQPIPAGYVRADWDTDDFKDAVLTFTESTVTEWGFSVPYTIVDDDVYVDSDGERELLFTIEKLTSRKMTTSSKTSYSYQNPAEFDYITIDGTDVTNWEKQK